MDWDSIAIVVHRSEMASILERVNATDAAAKRADVGYNLRSLLCKPLIQRAMEPYNGSHCRLAKGAGGAGSLYMWHHQ